MPIQLECRFRHRFTTAAKPGGTTGCPVCRRAGRRTSVRVPIGAAAIMREDQGADVGELGRLVAAWAAEAPAVTDWRRTPTEPSEYACDDCGAPLLWHSAHTALVCLACPASSISPGVGERAAAHAASLERRRVRGSGAELAVIDPDAEARAARARVRLRGQREALELLARRLEEVTAPGAHIRAQYKRLGFEVGAVLRGWLPEIREAADEAAIERIAAELEQVRTSPEYLELEREANQVQQQQLEREQYAAELEQQRAAAAAAEARQLAELERQQRAAPRPQPKAIAPRPGAAGLGSTSQTMVGVIAVIEQSRRDKARRLEKCGACDFPHRKPTPAERLYGIQTVDGWQNAGTGYQAPGTSTYRACSKHFEDAAAAINKTGFREPAVCYWELKA